MDYNATDHTFSICAYGDSEYIEECINSLIKQSVTTRIIMCTSTPSEYLERVAQKYGIMLYANTKRAGSSNIAADWNYAIECADTPLVTIAHQDDIYKPDYVLEVLNNLNKAKRPLIAFTDYAELRDNNEVSDIRNLNIKRAMLFLLRYRPLWDSVFLRRRILSLGSPICCPSVTYVKCNLINPLFLEGYKVNLDWQAWERISNLSGDFVYINSIQMAHRIHEKSETSKNIADNNRTREDYEMFSKFWPGYIARIIEHWYKKSEDQNSLNGV